MSDDGKQEWIGALRRDMIARAGRALKPWFFHEEAALIAAGIAAEWAARLAQAERERCRNGILDVAGDQAPGWEPAINRTNPSVPLPWRAALKREKEEAG